MVSRSSISRGWEFLCERPVTYPSMFIKSFAPIYKMSILLYLGSLHKFHVTCIVVTPELISDVLQVPRVDSPNYLASLVLRALSRDVLASRFCEISMS